jgi:hypothetical protein
MRNPRTALAIGIALSAVVGLATWTWGASPPVRTELSSSPSPVIRYTTSYVLTGNASANWTLTPCPPGGAGVGTDWDCLLTLTFTDASASGHIEGWIDLIWLTNLSDARGYSVSPGGERSAVVNASLGFLVRIYSPGEVETLPAYINATIHIESSLGYY